MTSLTGIPQTSSRSTRSSTPVHSKSRIIQETLNICCIRRNITHPSRNSIFNIKVMRNRINLRTDRTRSHFKISLYRIVKNTCVPSTIFTRNLDDKGCRICSWSQKSRVNTIYTTILLIPRSIRINICLKSLIIICWFICDRCPSLICRHTLHLRENSRFHDSQNTRIDHIRI